MEFMKANDIRKAFLDFFKSKDHYVKNSYSLVPSNDKSLLLINAGMAPLKNYFLGLETPPSKRMATCQKCVRTGDIENVGKTARHATFFEMLGNFSFGDYFKHDAIHNGWEFVTEVLKLPKDNLWISVYEEDDEAYNIWHDEIGISENRIVKLGKEDNFWEIGTGQGPCGPCSEIYIDRGEEYKCDNPNCAPGCDCDRFLEFWNLVFTQFDKQEDGSYKPLAHPNIDTGMGLERMACIMQNVESIFDIDTMKQIRDKVCEISGKKYLSSDKDDVSIRIITDHSRALTFLISDGVVPSNEGRGYVLRRLIRRAARHGRLLGIEKSFLVDMAKEVIAVYEDGYPELAENKDYICKILKVEEDRFGETLNQGISMLNEYIEEIQKEGKKEISGEVAFKFYDTYGFPMELTEEIAEEKGLKVDKVEFQNQMEEQKQRARQARSKSSNEGWKDELSSLEFTVKNTEFVGYDNLELETTIQDIIIDKSFVDSASEDDEIILVFDKTPFYANQGGQIGDKGTIVSDKCEIEVYDCQKTKSGLFLHFATVTSGMISKGDKVKLIVNRDLRLATQRNHTVTHLLHKALKLVLGDHVKQAGSLVEPLRLRFDFNHFEPMTAEEIHQVEEIVNREIYKASKVNAQTMPIEEAKKQGAESLFDEKYGDVVRVISVGDFSKEFCGGTHVSNSNDIGIFKLLSESGVASGVRRIEAITGEAVYKYILEKDAKIQEIQEIVKSKEDTLIKRVEDIVAENKDLQKQIEEIEAKNAKGHLDEIIKNKKEIKDTILMTNVFENQNDSILREMASDITSQFENAVVLFANVNKEESKISFIAMASKAIAGKKVHAGNFVKQIAQLTGGNGGGKPNMAQAGGKDIDKLEEAMNKASEILNDLIK